MGLHYFHANMTLEMVYCSAGIWVVMHLIASFEGVCVYLLVFISTLMYFCVRAQCLFFQFIVECFTSTSPALCDLGMLWGSSCSGFRCCARD